ncbi:MAG: Hpt domain-containing protein [Clostridiales bacterium]|jgi:HPt (histidine-containing phosphotransfer) domain-containing protein|nr:Hpt domain-containing protein [Clostridiales bacterium]
MPGIDIAEYVNIEEGLNRLRGNKAIYARMLKLFLAGEELSGFEAAIGRGDLKEAANVAHAIKGVAGNLSLNKLFELSALLMAKLRAGERDEAMIANFLTVAANTRESVNAVINEL